ncbi:MAG: hypothetical protein F6K48_06540 [Okeania sp. SIO3H1]|uniref:hypothetical protein n=1 Tax=Okeania sp. SIO1I7 TaxID=2607772 RepID=UPI0013C9EA26|nr:hypothetical protein [Okeania sp. SIO1I7]NEN88593.1 hypothetical protein [Okeania sp. SIO3H1]NET29331.1 hypothetical protein [Okeania sp. SIO1I7]
MYIISGVVKLVYDIHLNFLGVNPPLTPPRRGGEVRREEETGVEGESFLIA